MKKLSVILCCLLVLFMAGIANAGVITLSLPEFSSPYHDTGNYNDPYFVGNFSYDLNGETIVTATISGNWGNSHSSTTAHNLLYADEVLVADSRLADPDPYEYGFVAWSYTFLDFSTLLDGNVNFGTVQLTEHVIRLGQTTLVIETEPSGVPEPAIMLLLGIGLTGLAGVRRMTK